MSLQSCLSAPRSDQGQKTNNQRYDRRRITIATPHCPSQLPSPPISPNNAISQPSRAAPSALHLGGIGGNPPTVWRHASDILKGSVHVLTGSRPWPLQGLGWPCPITGQVFVSNETPKTKTRLGPFVWRHLTRKETEWDVSDSPMTSLDQYALHQVFWGRLPYFTTSWVMPGFRSEVIGMAFNLTVAIFSSI